MAVVEADSHAAMALPTARLGPSPEESLLQFVHDGDSRIREVGGECTLECRQSSGDEMKA